VLVLLVLLVGVGVERGGCGVGWLGTLLGPEASGALLGLPCGLRGVRWGAVVLVPAMPVAGVCLVVGWLRVVV